MGWRDWYRWRRCVLRIDIVALESWISFWANLISETSRYHELTNVELVEHSEKFKSFWVCFQRQERRRKSFVVQQCFLSLSSRLVCQLTWKSYHLAFSQQNCSIIYYSRISNSSEQSRKNSRIFCSFFNFGISLKIFKEGGEHLYSKTERRRIKIFWSKTA